MAREMDKRHKTIVLLLTVATLVGQTIAAEPTAVSLQLRWDHQFQFAGYYAAQWQGYYADAGLEVEIHSAIADDGSLISAIDEVASGKADFGIGATDISYARGHGAPLVVLASIFQHSAVAFFAPDDGRMRSPADLANLRVSRRLGDMVDVEFQAMLLAEGVDPGTIAPHPFDQSQGYLAGMQNGSVDVVPGYVIGTPHEALELGIELTMLRPIDYGVDFYGDSLFTTEAMVQSRPRIVEAFTDASLQGWEYALNHAEEIAERIVATFTPGFPLEDFDGFVHYQIEPVQELTLYPVVTLGNTNPARWQQMHRTLAGLGMVSAPYDPRVAVYDPVRAQRDRQARIRTCFFWGLLVVTFVAGASLVWVGLLRRTVRVRTERLERQERMYRELVERSPAIIYEFVPGYGGAYHSPQVKLLGYTPEETHEQPMLWYNSIHPDDVKKVDAMLASVRKDSPPVALEYRIRHRDGHWIWLLDRNYPRVDADGRIALTGVALDITEQKRLEEHLSTLVGVKEQLLQELNHRVKNNLLMVASLIRIKAESLGPEVDLSDILHQISAIRVLHEKLIPAESVGTVRLRPYVTDLLETLFSFHHSPVTVENDLPDISLPTRTAVPLGLIINEIATNAMKYGFGNKPAIFTIAAEPLQPASRYELRIASSGNPLPDDIDFDRPATLGLKLIVALAAQLRAELDVQRVPTPVFTFRLQLTDHQTPPT